MRNRNQENTSPLGRDCDAGLLRHTPGQTRRMARRMTRHLLACAIVFAALHAGAGYSASGPQQVFAAPGGDVITIIRDGDRVRMLEYQTIYRNGVNERWALVEFSDAHSSGQGWLRLDNVNQQKPEPSPSSPSPSQRSPSKSWQGPPTTPPQNYFRSPAPSESLAQTSIRDMDISCYRGARGTIMGCNLSVEVDIQAYAQSAGGAVLLCQADIHWFAVGGGEQVTSSQAYDNVNLYAGNLRRRLEMNFNFGGAGATGAMVENQRCQTQASSADTYSTPGGYR